MVTKIRQSNSDEVYVRAVLIPIHIDICGQVTEMLQCTASASLIQVFIHFGR